MLGPADSDGGLVGLAYIPSCATLVGLVFLLIFSLREAQLRTSPGVALGPSCCLELRLGTGCLC